MSDEESYLFDDAEDYEDDEEMNLSEPEEVQDVEEEPEEAAVYEDEDMLFREAKAYAAKKKVIIPVTKGGLQLKHPVTVHKKSKVIHIDGYHISQTQDVRRMALALLMHMNGRNASSLQKALVARRTLGKNRLKPKLLRAITSDIEWLGKMLRR